MSDPLWVGGAVWKLVFADRDEPAALDLVDQVCRRTLGAGIATKAFGRTSVGVVFGLVLEDARRVVAKVHQPRERATFLDAARKIQATLFERGFPCPQPLGQPSRLGATTITFEEMVDEGGHEDASDPAIRRALAETLARLLEMTREIGTPDAFDPGWRAWPSDGIWPVEAHSPIFDFAATARGAEWIDERAAEALRLLRIGEPIVGHADWGAKHVRFLEGRVRVVYDWDSLSVQSEEQLVGTAAATFTANPTLHDGVYEAPTPDETRAFVADYSAARARALTATQRRAVHASAAYIVAYCARCEHALGRRGRFTDALERAGAEYLDPG